MKKIEKQSNPKLMKNIHHCSSNTCFTILSPDEVLLKPKRLILTFLYNKLITFGLLSFSIFFIHVYICVCVCVVIHRQTVSLYHNSSVKLDT